MAKVLPSRLERDLYQDECRAWNPHGPSSLTYYVVTDPSKFRFDFVGLFERKTSAFPFVTHTTGESATEKKAGEKIRPNIRRQRDIVLRALESDGDAITIENMTSNPEQKIDLIKVPIQQRDLA